MLLDWIVIVVYLLLVVYIAFKSAKNETIEGYFANHRTTKLSMMLCSQVATAVGAGMVVGVAAEAFRTGISYPLMFAVSASTSALLFASIAKKIKAFGDKHKAITIGDFLEHRYGKITRIVFACGAILLAIIWGSAQYSAVAHLFTIMLGAKYWLALLLTLIVTISYTAAGGLRSDIFTDFLQFWVMLISFMVLVPLALFYAGGTSSITQLPQTYFDPLAFGGLTVLLGGIFLSGLVNVPSVDSWQRIYAAESGKTSQKAFLFAIPLILFFIGAAMISGMLAVKLAPYAVPEQALFEVMKLVMPAGLLGLGFAGIIALVMSSVDSLTVGASATILKDVYQRVFRKQKKHEADKQMMRKARLVTFLFGTSCAIIAFFFRNIVQLSLFAAYTALCFVPAILAGLWWKKTTSKAAIASIVSSLITLYGTAPFIGKIAFVPTLIVGAGVLMGVSYLTKHGKSEEWD